MHEMDMINQLRSENEQLKADNEMLEKTVAQLRETLNKMIDRYVSGKEES